MRQVRVIGAAFAIIQADWLICLMAQPPIFTNTLVNVLSATDVKIVAIPGHDITVLCTANTSGPDFTTLKLSSSFGVTEDNNIGQQTILSTNRTLYGREILIGTNIRVNCSRKGKQLDQNLIYGTVTTSWFNDFIIKQWRDKRIHGNRSIIKVNCSLPTMTPQPDVTLRYQGSVIATNKGSTEYNLNVTKEDNGRPVDCCVAIPLAGSTCINLTLDVLYPPQSAAIMVMSISKEKVIVKCTTEESNPVSNITWSVEGGNRTLPSKTTINLGSHSGHVSSQTLEVTEIDDNVTITIICSVTNHMFPNLKLSKQIQVNVTDQGMFNSPHEDIVPTIILLAVSGLGLVCMVGGGTLFLLRHRHHTDRSRTDSRTDNINQGNKPATPLSKNRCVKPPTPAKPYFKPQNLDLVGNETGAFAREDQIDQPSGDADEPENGHARQGAITEHIRGNWKSDEVIYENSLPQPPSQNSQLSEYQTMTGGLFAGFKADPEKHYENV